MPVTAPVALIRQNAFLKAVLDNMQIGIIIADAEGTIIYINKTYARFLNISIADSLGKHANEVVSNSRLHTVAKTGQAEINYPHRFKDVGYLVHRVPIRLDGEVAAVLGLVLFDSASTAVKLAEKLAYLETQLKHFQKELAAYHTTRYTFDHIVGVSEAVRGLKTEARQAARSDLPVLITGESGTGKELFAQAVHHASPRRPYPFVRVNCAALPRELLESELFGYEKGAFTGAGPKGKPGKFELAHMGTIFLDEIGDLPLDMQPKLLRVLESKEFERIGGTAVIASDFRLIAATNQNLDRMIKSGSFRRDLFYRLNVISLGIPPLRERREDILPLVYHFIEKTVKGPEGKAIRVQKAAEKAMQSYNWPGNGRELLHTIERLLHISGDDVIGLANLPDYVRLSAPLPDSRVETDLKVYLKSAEKHLIHEVLRQTDGNKTAAAEMLGIHRTLLYRKMKLLGMKA